MNLSLANQFINLKRVTCYVNVCVTTRSILLISGCVLLDLSTPAMTRPSSYHTIITYNSSIRPDKDCN